MRVAVYARVSTTRQARAQTIEQQLERLRAAVAGRGWELEEQHVYRDDGYSGASLGRPGLDRLRDHAALADLDAVLVTAPDRLARNYVHQVLLIDELAGHGCRVEFLDRPMSQDPHDQLLVRWGCRDGVPCLTLITGEVPDAGGGVCAGLDHPAGSGADDRAAA